MTDRERRALLAWYRQNRRDLPWRRTRDPYAILLAEVLLQQTQVQRAIPFYRRILARFPTLAALGEAPLEALLELWQGAGYYRRAHQLHALARATGGVLPETYAELRRLPGLGPYTAGAVASIAFGEAVPAVDGNARRVLARYYGLTAPGEAELWRLAGALVDAEAPGEWNQALIELGATRCTPKKPACAGCPLVKGCRGKLDPGRFPLPRRTRKKPLDLFALVLVGREGVVLVRREGKRFSGLYGVPMGEDLGALLREYGLSGAAFAGEVRHGLTHLDMRVRVYWARVDAAGQDAASKPLSVLDRKILKKFEEAFGEAGALEADLPVAPLAQDADPDAKKP